MAPEPTKQHIGVRDMTPEDFAMVGTLSAELGYPVSQVDLADRFEAIEGSSDHRLMIAHSQEEVVGWCHVYCVRLLESEGYVELGGIVVSQKWRRRGVGRALIAEAETWTRSRGLTRLRAYSGAHREQAHGFYRALGYDQEAPAMFQTIFLDNGG